MTREERKLLESARVKLREAYHEICAVASLNYEYGEPIDCGGGVSTRTLHSTDRSKKFGKIADKASKALQRVNEELGHDRYS